MATLEQARSEFSRPPKAAEAVPEATERTRPDEPAGPSFLGIARELSYTTPFSAKDVADALRVVVPRVPQHKLTQTMRELAETASKTGVTIQHAAESFATVAKSAAEFDDQLDSLKSVAKLQPDGLEALREQAAKQGYSLVNDTTRAMYIKFKTSTDK
jgi:hypothetical protein